MKMIFVEKALVKEFEDVIVGIGSDIQLQDSEFLTGWGEGRIPYWEKFLVPLDKPYGGVREFLKNNFKVRLTHDDIYTILNALLKIFHEFNIKSVFRLLWLLISLALDFECEVYDSWRSKEEISW